jgi:hypothetical protein
MKTPQLPFALALFLVGPACGSESGDDDDDVTGPDAAADIDAVAALSIPDPGTAMNNWLPTPADWCTPDKAHPVGVVTQQPGYMEGTLCADTGSGFYVFRAGAGFTELTVAGVGGDAQIDYVHLHRGDGLVFGDTVTPTASTEFSGTWPVTPDSIYVLEIHAPGGGFY